MVKISGKEGIISLVAAIVLLGAALYFFMISVSLMSFQQPRVTASLLALIIGFVCLSSSLNLFKLSLFSRAASEEEPRAGE